MEESMNGEIQQESATSIEYENENSEIQNRAYTSGGIENQNGKLVNDIKKMLEMAGCTSLSVVSTGFHVNFAK